MITIVAKKIIKQGKTKEFKDLVEKLINESRNEAGCIAYNLYEDINNSNILTFIEEWKSEEDIKLHNCTEHYTSIVPKLAELQEGKTEVNLYKMI
ncbi:antibiotic biosynthesis monooxygenase [Clostridium sp. CS001]|uniref:putative quinol monooxygenase n=1 Tax=Clostridium sp. CS001 TaxID=2880648 RepID=UPI001CF5B770|nr:putative quinol monooxygenase [Clostridium sp. CS001]MCB2291160.1 antibiotic biosynthesis monooxygenase [Clostridium sp. CS001]